MEDNDNKNTQRDSVNCVDFDSFGSGRSTAPPGFLGRRAAPEFTGPTNQSKANSSNNRHLELTFLTALSLKPSIVLY